MADIPGNGTTTSTVSVGGTVTGSIETVGDHDWFRINLTAGQQIVISLNGSGATPLEDPYVYLRNSAGALIVENDDGGSGRDSRLVFTVTTTGTYYIDVAAWGDATHQYTGTYQLSVTPWTPPPVWTHDQVAEQLVSGYWEGSSHHFNVSQGGSLTVNLTLLTATAQNLARQALAVWSDVIGVNFVEVSNGGQITFDDNEEGAHAEAQWANGITTSAHVNVATDWLSSGSGLYNYGFQTYIHEIGHALGLGHAGDYNGDARYPYDAEFLNDAWPLSVMSYFSATESDYYTGLGFTENYVMAPMMADILAMSELYGLSTTTRTGDTTYGFNSNAGRNTFNANLYPNAAYAIFVNGGIDTLDYSGFSQTQRIDLNPETFSNIGGNGGNVSIARGVIIENAIGGSGSDTIIGNGANNVLTGNVGVDTLTGGAGADTFRDLAAGLNGDRISDFTAEDRIVIVNADLSTFSFSLNGNTLSFTGGSVTLTAVPAGTIVATAAAGGGVQLSIAQAIAQDARNDFNGDGRSDILFRHASSGEVVEWLGQTNGSFAGNQAAYSFVHPSWDVGGIGDFNGDGREDVMWRNAGTGDVVQWLGQANGSFIGNVGGSYNVPAGWNIAATGDFNGDGRDDVLWRHDGGEMVEWLGQPLGNFMANQAAYSFVHPNWEVGGTGDFNGDGRDDIMLRNATTGDVVQWLGQTNGSFIGNTGGSYNVPGAWSIAATGDFNGDGRDDILWRHDGGEMVEWLGQPLGNFMANQAAYNFVHPSWELAATGDYNGDGRDDILWRHQDGALAEWLGQSNGGFAANNAASAFVHPDWHIQPELF